MRKFTTICLAAIVAVLFSAGCNSDSPDYSGENTSSGVAVYSFSLSADDKVMENLDTVFFSINLNEALIFNADSLPYGTSVKRLVPKITMLETISKADLIVPGYDGKEDTTYNYLTSSTDSIDFTNPVYLDVQSPDGLVSRRYTIKVNVHTAVTDSLVWDRMAYRTLPTDIAAPAAQRTVATADTYYCLTTDGSRWCMGRTGELFDGSWELSVPAMPAGTDISTFAATADRLFIVAGGSLYSSADGGESWSDTGERWNNIYGAVGDKLLGNRQLDGVWQYAQFPAGGLDGVAMPAAMPVEGTSQLIDFTFPLSAARQAVTMGGVRADGSFTGAVWSYDGRTWAEINPDFSLKLRDITLLPYYTIKVSNALVATEQSVIMALGGVDMDDVINDSVFVSRDYGMTWSKAPQLMQLPDYVPDFYGAQAFVQDATMGSRSASLWTEMPFAYRLPATAVFEPFAASRATTPVTTWECPFIYLFGGCADGVLHNSLWRATINRFVFKPIQ